MMEKEEDEREVGWEKMTEVRCISTVCAYSL